MDELMDMIITDESPANISDKIKDAVSKMGEMNSNSLGMNDQGRSTIRKEYTRFYNFIRAVPIWGKVFNYSMIC